jgi:hypothetical protein
MEVGQGPKWDCSSKGKKKAYALQTLIRTVMTFSCPAWAYAADAQLLKLQYLQNRVLRSSGNLDRCMPVRELHVDFKIPYVDDHTSKLCRTHAEVILNHENPNVHGIGKGEAILRKYNRLKLGGG